MSSMVQDDLYKPLSNDFLVPTNRDIGAIENTDGGPYRAFGYSFHTYRSNSQMKNAPTCVETLLGFFPKPLLSRSETS